MEDSIKDTVFDLWASYTCSFILMFNDKCMLSKLTPAVAPHSYLVLGILNSENVLVLRAGEVA